MIIRSKKEIVRLCIRAGGKTPAISFKKLLGDNSSMAETKNIVVAEHICKSYVGVQALDDVSITIKEGEIKCLAG